MPNYITRYVYYRRNERPHYADISFDNLKGITSVPPVQQLSAGDTTLAQPALNRIEDPNSSKNAAGFNEWFWLFEKWIVVGGADGKNHLSIHANDESLLTYAPEVTVGESDIIAYAIYFYAGGPTTGDTSAVLLEAVDDSITDINSDDYNIIDKASFFKVTTNPPNPNITNDDLTVQANTGVHYVTTDKIYLDPNNTGTIYNVSITALDTREYKFSFWEVLGSNVMIEGNTITVQEGNSPLVHAHYVSNVLSPCASLQNQWNIISDILDASNNRRRDLAQYTTRLTNIYDQYANNGCEPPLNTIDGFFPE